MKPSTLLAPAVLAAGLFATPSKAHDTIVASVVLPPIVVDAGGVQVTVGLPAAPVPVFYQPAPPPRVVVVEQQAPIVVQRPMVVEQVVYVDEPRCGHHHRGRGWGHVKHHHHHGHGQRMAASTARVYRR